MDQPGAKTTHDALALDGSAPYAGGPGQTRYDSVHLVQPDGSLRSVAVCRVVNVKTHPELGERALAGTLHRLDDGAELALSFVYHDPDARRFALVVPRALAHLELKEWSRLLSEIADDTRHPVPPYVRESATVLGTAALARFLDGEGAVPAAFAASLSRGSLAPLDGERESLLAQRERELLEQERNLIRMAEGLTAREGELNRRSEQLETARVDLEIREAELSDREGPPRAGPERASGAWQEVTSHESGGSEATVVASVSSEMAAAFAAAQRESEATRSVPPPLRPRPRTGPPPLPLPHRPGRVTPPPLHPHGRDDALTVVARPSEPPPLPGHGGRATDAAPLVTTEIAEPAPDVAPPDYFAGQSPGQMALKLKADELWLFVHLTDPHTAAFRHGPDLMLQYAATDGYPVAVLSLVDPGDPEPYAIRLALDGRAEADLRVLEHLSRSFRARVARYVDGLFQETVTVATLREGVAQAICDQIRRLPLERSATSATEAMMRVLHAPPPLSNDDLPFGPARRETPTTLAVHAAVEQLACWLRPDKLAEALLTYSVPHNVVDATVRRVIRAAIVFGIALPDALRELALGHGVVPDEASLLRDQLAAFRLRVTQGENDLGAEATRRNWEELLAQARAVGLSPDPELHAPRDGAPAPHGDERASSERPFEGAAPAELRALLDDPAQRLEAIRELCTRGHAGAIESIAQILPELSVGEAAVAVAQLLNFGEAAGDTLIAALSSPEQHTRQFAALGLGRLRLRRALAPLLHALQGEESPAWQEMARAVGDFGSGGLRVLVRAIPGASRPERVMTALAHLANHGCAKEVEKLENDPEVEVAQAARRAMARRSRMEWEDLAVREQRTLTDDNPAARASQAFFAEAAKVDI